MSRVHKRAAGSVILALGGLLTILLASPPAQAGPSLRYRLDVGDRLVYERHVQVVPLDGRAAPERYTEQLQLCCLSREREETLLLLADLTRIANQQVQPARGAVFKLDRRGHRRFSNEVLVRVAELEPLFETLPILPRPLEADSTWLTDPDRFGRRWRCTRAAIARPAEGPVRVDFELADPTGAAEILGQAQRGSYWFDSQAGIVVRVESESSDRSANRRTLVVTRLHTKLKQDALWCERRIAETQRFLHTLRLEDRLLEQVVTEPARVEQILPHVERLWAELILDLSREPQSPLRRLAQGQRARLADELDGYREQAALARQWIGKEAAHWSLQTPDDETIRSETVRDRFVVECFWSASSLWSLRSFDMLRRLQEQLPAEDFRIVCLNIDADAAAGRRAARLCGAGLTHVLAGAPVGGEPPRELPVFRVLDRDSRVLRVYFGWQPALAERISALQR
jgi:hypothetical protein